jgi:hypothetical protein
VLEQRRNNFMTNLMLARGFAKGGILRSLSKPISVPRNLMPSVFSFALLCGFCVGCSETAAPILEPFLVGHWEANLRLEGDAWFIEYNPVYLELYEDGGCSLDGLKGTWSFADVSRGSVRIEIPRRYETNSYDLVLDDTENKEESLTSGIMKYSGRTLMFTQLQRGGPVGVFETMQAYGKGGQADDRAASESAKKALSQKGWRQTIYTFGHCMRYGASHGVSCG